jgi:hypothetical protein
MTGTNDKELCDVVGLHTLACKESSEDFVRSRNLIA